MFYSSTNEAVTLTDFILTYFFVYFIIHMNIFFCKIYSHLLLHVTYDFSRTCKHDSCSAFDSTKRASDKKIGC